MTTMDFNKKYWNYYVNLENDVIQLLSYVAMRESNWETNSNKIISLALNIGAEFDFLCKVVCNFNPNDRKTITDYAKTLIDTGGRT